MSVVIRINQNSCRRVTACQDRANKKIPLPLLTSNVTAAPTLLYESVSYGVYQVWRDDLPTDWSLIEYS